MSICPQVEVEWREELAAGIGKIPPVHQRRNRETDPHGHDDRVNQSK